MDTYWTWAPPVREKLHGGVCQGDRLEVRREDLVHERYLAHLIRNDQDAAEGGGPGPRHPAAEPDGLVQQDSPAAPGGRPRRSRARHSARRISRRSRARPWWQGAPLLPGRRDARRPAASRAPPPSQTSASSSSADTTRPSTSTTRPALRSSSSIARRNPSGTARAPPAPSAASTELGTIPSSGSIRAMSV